ncbi:MAG: hypothetical protein KAJ98_00380 [Spirochaetaceae bacterium]|nr:hypothetical protein [Spirochaetaceae bacterium]
MRPPKIRIGSIAELQHIPGKWEISCYMYLSRSKLLFETGLHVREISIIQISDILPPDHQAKSIFRPEGIEPSGTEPPSSFKQRRSSPGVIKHNRPAVVRYRKVVSASKGPYQTSFISVFRIDEIQLVDSSGAAEDPHSHTINFKINIIVI